ncbi:hypothetical protein [Flavobacterium sp.]|uniref:hypothetical protein n=1 Tax=Flavobacterium sp. TaxID=239 RepID=UPI00404742B0
MSNTFRYPLKKKWLYSTLAIGIINLVLSTNGIIRDGFKPIYIISLLIAICSTFQYHNYKKTGYVVIKEEMITITNGLLKKTIQLKEVKTIIKKNNSYQLVLKNGKSCYIVLNAVPKMLKNDLDTKLHEIKNSLNNSN